MNTKRIIQLLPIIALCVGCGTVQQPQTPEQQAIKVERFIESAVFTGASVHLVDNPEDKPHIDAIRTSIGTVLGDTNVTSVQAVQVVQAIRRIPKGDKYAGIVIGNAQIYFEDFAASNPNAEMRPFLVAVHRGLGRALQ